MSIPSFEPLVVMPLTELLEASRSFVHPHITNELARVRTAMDMQDLVLRVMLMITEYSQGRNKYVLFSALEDDAKNVIMGHPNVTLGHRTLLVRISAGAWTPHVDARFVVSFDDVVQSSDSEVSVPATDAGARRFTPFDVIRSSDSEELVPATQETTLGEETLEEEDVVPETPQTPEEEVGTSWQPCQRRRITATEGCV